MAALDDPWRLAEFNASILKLDRDHVLDECVVLAARRAETPMAMVSFVMKKIQLFRTAVGLPPELEATRATSRQNSFCQVVVTTEAPLVVTDARTDPRVPRRLVDVVGITSYVGVPIRVGGQVLGSLCVADTVPRQWSPDVVGDLGALAGRVSDRLEALTALGVVDEITVVPPSSLAIRASVLAQSLRRSLVEIGPMVRLAQGAADGLTLDALVRAGSLLTEASDFYDELLEAAGELCVATKRVEQSVGAKPPRVPGEGDVTCQSTRR